MDTWRSFRWGAGIFSWLLILALSAALHGSVKGGETSPVVDQGVERPAAESAPDEGNAENKANQQAVRRPAAGESAAGWRMRLTLPITSQTYQQVRRFTITALDRATASGGKPVLIFEFHVVPGQSEFGRGSDFGPSYQLAEFLSGGRLADATTVAFLTNSIQGHAVLAALACDEIVMAPDAEIAAAGADEETITNTVRLAYEEIANRKRRIPGGVAMALVDPRLELLRVETEYSTEYVTREQLAELNEKKLAIPGSEEVLIRAGEPGRFTGREARRHGFISYLGENLRDVCRAMNVRPESLHEDPSLGSQWVAARVDLIGPITAEAVNKAQRMIETAVGDRRVNFVCVWLDTEGGMPAESVRLAIFLATGLDPSKVRTVAYIPERALADAALIALACNELVMGPRAVLGGRGGQALSEEQLRQLQLSIRETLAPATSQGWSLPAAMIDPTLEVFAYERLDDFKHTEYFCEQELAEQAEPDAWQKGQRITTPGQPLSVSGTEAVDLWLADHLADHFAAFKTIYGLENDPTLLEPSWADRLIDALASPPVAVFLLVIGFVALYVELQTPGIGIGGFCAALCFMIFFWSRFLGGTAGWLEVLLFLAGVFFLLVEIFVLPGFGIFGLGGGLLVLVSIVLASQTFVLPHNTAQLVQLKGSLMILVGAGIGTVAVVLLIQRWLPRLSTLPEVEEAIRHETLVNYDDLVGTRGRTTTKLIPSGKARFDDRLVDVIADCEMVERGCEVEVVEVRGNRVFVRPIP